MLSVTDIHHWLDGSEFMGERLVVQFARGGNRPRDDFGHGAPRMAPRPRRTVHRMTITGLPPETSWQVSSPVVLLRSTFFDRQCTYALYRSSSLPQSPELSQHISSLVFDCIPSSSLPQLSRPGMMFVLRDCQTNTVYPGLERLRSSIWTRCRL